MVLLLVCLLVGFFCDAFCSSVWILTGFKSTVFLRLFYPREDFGYVGKWADGPSMDQKFARKRAMQIPLNVQCGTLITSLIVCKWTRTLRHRQPTYFNPSLIFLLIRNITPVVDLQLICDAKLKKFNMWSKIQRSCRKSNLLRARGGHSTISLCGYLSLRFKPFIYNVHLWKWRLLLTWHRSCKCWHISNVLDFLFLKNSLSVNFIIHKLWCGLIISFSCVFRHMP